MKDPTSFFIYLGILVALTAFGYFWLWFILKRPEKWAVWVDLENDFWVRHGIISPAFAERCRRREKGLPMMLVVGIIPVLGSGCLISIAIILARIFLFRAES